jgi:hypothetical protein
MMEGEHVNVTFGLSFRTQENTSNGNPRERTQQASTEHPCHTNAHHQYPHSHGIFSKPMANSRECNAQKKSRQSISTQIKSNPYSGSRLQFNTQSHFWKASHEKLRTTWHSEDLQDGFAREDPQHKLCYTMNYSTITINDYATTALWA